MDLPKLSINRPVLATVMSLVILLLGVIAYNFLGVREYPDADPPVITVSSEYTGANAEVIEAEITEPLEDAISAIAGIESITSTSREGRSTIRVEFGVEENLEEAANEVRDRVGNAQRRLPDDADAPSIRKSDADASPIIFLNIQSDERDLMELTEIADRQFRERFQTISGVSEVDIWGSKRYSIRLQMDPEKLSAYNLSPLDVRQAVERENIELPSGLIEGKSAQLSIRTMGRINNPEEFDNLIIKEEEGEQVTFSDIGVAKFAPEDERTLLRRDGISMTGVVLRPQTGANHLEIADEFYAQLEQIKPDVPNDINLEIGFDDTEYIRDSISEVQQTIFLALIMVVLVIIFFLRDWRTVVIPLISIPISLVGTFFIMYAFDFSINVLTLLGIVLAIGIVVDDAIVMMENIYKKIEAGDKPIDAGKKGVSEIFFAIVATTVSLVAVFFPIVFMGGITGQLFQEFGVVISGAVVISSFVALTFTPMISTRLLKKRENPNRLYHQTEPFFQWLTETYRKALQYFLDNRWIAIGIIILSLGLIFVLGRGLPSELAPTEDRGDIRIFVDGPEEATFEFMDEHISDLKSRIQNQIPEAEGVISVTSPGFGAGGAVNSGFLRLVLEDAGERDRSQDEIAGHLWGIVGDITAVNAVVIQPPTIGGGGLGGRPVEYVIQAPDLDNLREVLPEIEREARNHPDLTGVDIDLTFNSPELRVDIDRNRARDLGVSVTDISQTLQAGLSEQRYGFFIRDGRQRDIIGELQDDYRRTPDDLAEIRISNDNGELVPMENMVDIREVSNPPQLFRYNRFASATVEASLPDGRTVADGLAAMDGVAGNVLDGRFSTALSGRSKDYEEGTGTLYFAFLLAIVLAFLVLAAQFESFRDPLIILFTVPLAIAGAVFALWYFFQSLNVFSQIGIIMLVGLVTKNGILIVEFANQRKNAGLPFYDAIREGAVARFRPILMTSFTTIFGYLPIAMAIGAGAESRMPLGIAVVGGLIYASILTLFVIPVIYSFISSKEKHIINDESEE